MLSHIHTHTLSRCSVQGHPPPHLIMVARVEWHWAVADANAEPRLSRDRLDYAESLWSGLHR